MQKLVDEVFFFYVSGVTEGAGGGGSGTLQPGCVLWRSGVAAEHKEELSADGHGGVRCFSCR